jgi:hypothetical protein
VVGAVVLGVTAPAIAGAEEAERVIREEDKVVYEKKTRVDFNNGQIDGELTRPDVDVVRASRKSRFDSMIKKRTDFNKELRESLDE